MEEEIVEQLHAIVKGKVQNVFFRDTTRKYAEKIGLKGGVRNLSDGSVEIIAEGKRSQLEKLLQNLQTDSGRGRVDHIEKSYKPAENKYKDFQIWL